MDESLRSILIGTSGLSVLFVVAVILVLVRPRPAQDPEALDQTLRLFLLGIAVFEVALVPIWFSLRESSKSLTKARPAGSTEVLASSSVRTLAPRGNRTESCHGRRSWTWWST